MDVLNLSAPNLPLNLITTLVISIILGFAFSFFRGASMGRLIFSVIASIAGFYFGQFIAGVFHWNFVVWNGVHLIEGILGSLLVLWVINS
ncbi:hypothetical protein TFLX_04509 [Thermoflexales bacterium]|jgi:uncharacterized membrane protein YeaQ/YmgE (transglycosylase-associated protein family)|nr:hypothetical protein TFLX_04509 [Thermoflexales bacterium]